MVLDRFFGNSRNGPPSSFEKLDKEYVNKSRPDEDEFFRGFFGGSGVPPLFSDLARQQQQGMIMKRGFKVDETEDLFTVSMDVPGVNPSEIKVKLEHAMVCINGQRTFKEGNHTSSSQFHQCVRASSHLDATNATADLSNGVLVVSAPKLPKQAVVEIPITQGRS
ncbi:expressed unknown protein [Seminavis robusta]|uniref:SHSP domain-containing protein n=1 Tax=Seminavis robusta TaxID=568900 RepID=A0A9N8DDB5_9STRA|nr:expressed unknown protein [Seminavis robusta]|eukprot:Sro102_g051870.1 n/a (165) ;mRNA; r:4548-5042